MHKHPHKHHTPTLKLNPLKKLEKLIMRSVNELLAAIATIANGNGTDPKVLADVNDLKTQMLANNAKLAANDADDAASKVINDEQQVLIEALIDKLASAPAPSGIPTVTAVSSSSGSVNGGETITLTGTLFTGTTGVMFGTVAASNLSVTSDTSLTVVAPAQAAATVSVVVTNAAGASLASVHYHYS